MYKIVGKQEKTIKNLGGKGFNLLKLDKLKFTPNFVIIGNSIFNEYLKKDSLLFNYLKDNFSEKINLRFIKKRVLQFKPDKNLLIKINNTLNQLSINKFIIRSSFISEDSKNLSYAGLFSSYRCHKKNDIFRYIKKVWASQFTERVFNYQKEKKDFRYGMAVIIQEFIQPDFSGVVFLQQNRPQEILIEYCEKSYQGIESGTKNPLVYVWRDSFPYLSSSVSKAHSKWIQDLINQILKCGKEYNGPLDIEFAVSNKKVWLLQVRPLTKKINTGGRFFIFERQKRWKYHLNDFSIRKFRKILKELNIKISPEIEKRKEGVVITGNSYFLFIDEIKSKSTKLIFLGHFYKYFLEFILSQYNKAKRTSKDLVSIISAVKELNFKMSVIDFVHNLIIKNLKEFLILKYNLTESKNLAYFIPSLSFTTQSFLLSVNNNKKIPNFYDQELLGRLDKHSINKLISNVEANQKRISKTLKAVRGEQLRYFVMLKKLIWLRDLVDYYYDVITSFYGNSVCLVLSRENIKYPFRDSLELCRFSMNKIKEIGKNKVCPESDFLSEERQKMASQEKQALPLKGVIASQGNFSGIARIIKDFSDIKRVGPKDILVSQYTRPSLVVGMAICKGIITEEGGLTSHAAIVSRELGKPCLIGVERCTNAIKDGDKIKVVDGKIYKLK